MRVDGVDMAGVDGVGGGLSRGWALMRSVRALTIDAARLATVGLAIC